MLIPNNNAWTCPKRRRGTDYVTSTGIQSGDPSITGFLSYGFNEIGVFGGPDPTTGEMTGTVQKFKSANVQQPSSLVAICDVSGSNDPSLTDGIADAAWLDTEWAGYSGSTQAIGAGSGSFNYRVQTAYGKHDNRLNFIYVDGHAAASYASAITWGQFWGIFTPGVSLLTAGTTQRSDLSISRPAYDSVQWSGSPE
jgi:prepilin-type processing-associated H-X9-DG protein